MKHILNDEQKEMFLRRTMSVYSEYKKDFPHHDMAAYKTAMGDFCDNLIFVSSELTYDLSHLRNDIEDALEIQDEIDSESDEPTDDSFERDWCGFCDMSVDADVEGSRLVCPHCGTYI